MHMLLHDPIDHFLPVVLLVQLKRRKGGKERRKGGKEERKKEREDMKIV